MAGEMGAESPPTAQPATPVAAPRTPQASAPSSPGRVGVPSGSQGAQSRAADAQPGTAVEGSDAEAELDERELFGSDEEAGSLDERELFGSDDDAETQPPGGAAAPDRRPREPAPSEPSEMDEQEIFGEVSDDEPDKVEDVIVRRRPAPGEDREFVAVRLPNILSFEKDPFDSGRIKQTMLEGYQEYKNTQNKNATRLLNPENCVRWRFKKGPDGQNVTDEEGRPQYETNSRLVEWEDGSKTLFVGREAFNISEIADNVYLFEENSQDIHVCHGTVPKRLVVTPLNLESTTHEMLKRTQYRKFEPLKRSLLMSQEEYGQREMENEQAEKEKEKQKKDQKKQRKSLEEVQQAALMTAAELEDDGGVGPSLAGIKQDAKREAKRLRDM